MKNLLLSVLCLLLVQTLAVSQDEGVVVKRERIQRDKSIFVGGGVSSVLGNNFGDYSTGVNFEAGYLKRMNRLISLGASLSYLKFKYDPSIVQRLDAGGFPLNFYYNSPGDDGFLLQLSGGDISMVSLAFNLKINFVPVKDNSVISIYAFAKPFIASANRSDVSGFGEYYYNASTSTPIADATNNDIWNKSIPGLEGLGSKSSITGGIFLGPGIELFPAKKISFFLQASLGYTFNTNLVSTRSYGNDYTVDYSNANFPLKDLGFSSINFAGGISFNLD